jgi:hypothetical protein
MSLFKGHTIPRDRQGSMDNRTLRKPETTVIIGDSDSIKGSIPGQDNVLICIIGEIGVRAEFYDLHGTAGHDAKAQEEEGS